MNNRIRFFLTTCSICATCCLFSQRYDYNFIHKVYGLSANTDSGASISYSEVEEDIIIGRFEWNGGVSSSPILSNSDGNFLGFTNGIHLYDSLGRFAINGEENNVVGASAEYILNEGPLHNGLYVQHSSQFIPIDDSLYYLFFLSNEFIQALPEFEITRPQEKGLVLAGYSNGLYLSKVRLNSDGRLYVRQDEKAIKLIDDLLGLAELIFCKKADNEGWWALVPRAEHPEAYRLNLSGSGEIENIDLVYFSDQNGRLFSEKQMAFNHNGDKLVRITGQSTVCFWDKLEVFDFDRCTGEINRIFLDSISQPDAFSFDRDIQFSANDRFLYFSQGSVIYQFEMDDPNFFENREIVAEWDGFLYLGGFPPLFGMMWELPNEKILVGSFVSTPYLHYIHDPNQPGVLCNFEQRAIEFPIDPLQQDDKRVRIDGLPSYPQYRMKPLDKPCWTNINPSTSNTPIQFIVSPNPTQNSIQIYIDGNLLLPEEGIFRIVNTLGQIVYKGNLNNRRTKVNLSEMENGSYFVQIELDNNLKSVLPITIIR